VRLAARRLLRTAVLLSIVAFAAFAAAQEPPAPIATASVKVPQLPRSTAEAKIDGVLDDAIWKDALTIDLTTETDPGENVPAPVVTHAYLVEDGKRLLIAFDARDPDPKSIRAYLRDRDRAFNDDFVGIVIDSFGDKRYAYEFFANALGVQMDLTNDDVSRRESESWDAIWDSAGKLNSQGFVVEMAIPLSQLRFRNTDGERVWGIDVLRFRQTRQAAGAAVNAGGFHRVYKLSVCPGITRDNGGPALLFVQHGDLSATRHGANLALRREFLYPSLAF